jgi:hypothetical protein
MHLTLLSTSGHKRTHIKPRKNQVQDLRTKPVETSAAHFHLPIAEKENTKQKKNSNNKKNRWIPIPEADIPRPLYAPHPPTMNLATARQQKEPGEGGLITLEGEGTTTVRKPAKRNW